MQVSISFFVNMSAFSTKSTKKWRNSHNYHVIIFYIIYVDNLIENIFRAVSFLHFVQLKSCSLFWVTSDSIRWIFSTGIWCREKHLYSNILHFFERRAKKIQPGKFEENSQTENVCASLEKMQKIWE